MTHPVIIVDYDPQWPILYEEEKSRILGVVGQKILALEHIGGTAVPNLAAKPIVDMMAGVRGPSDADECVPILRKIGYDDVTVPGENPDWYYCLGKGPHSVGYHLHLVKYQSEHWGRHIIFRDQLRSNQDAAHRYSDLKKKLAAELGTNRKAYTEAKTSFIESLIAEARPRNSSMNR